MHDEDFSMRAMLWEACRDAAVMYFVIPLALWRLLEDTADDVRNRRPRLRTQVAELQEQLKQLQAKLDANTDQ